MTCLLTMNLLKIRRLIGYLNEEFLKLYLRTRFWRVLGFLEHILLMKLRTLGLLKHMRNYDLLFKHLITLEKALCFVHHWWYYVPANISWSLSSWLLLITLVWSFTYRMSCRPISSLIRASTVTSTYVLHWRLRTAFLRAAYWRL